MRMGAVQSVRSALHRTAYVWAWENPYWVLKSFVMSLYVSHTWTPSPVSPTAIQSLSKKWPAGPVGVHATVWASGQQSGSDMETALPQLGDVSVATVERYTTRPLGAGLGPIPTGSLGL